jgi:3-hydroxyisobutyrate dehydrogenase
MSKIGFIGLGNMGLPMAKNLLVAGHEVTAFDLSQETVSKAVAAGAVAASSVVNCLEGVDVVVSMVPAGPHVKSLYIGAHGIIENASKETLFIDCSTIDVATARVVNAEASKAGFDMVDAPVSGGVGGAEAGTLTFMVGGTEQAFGRAKPILDVMGGRIIHTGGAGNGEAAKICNNMLLAISMIGSSEIFALGRKLGLDDQVLFDVASTSSGRCWSLDTYCPVPGPVPKSPANDDYKAGFAVDMMLKDLRLAKMAAETTGANTPLGAMSEQLYTKLSQDGQGDLDFSAVFKMLDKKI